MSTRTLPLATPKGCLAVNVLSSGYIARCEITTEHPIEGRHVHGPDEQVTWSGTAPDTTGGLSRYAWIIDKDHLDLVGVLGPDADDTRTTGPYNAPTGLLQRLAAGEGVPFRMYDDDGELYYTGRLVGPPGIESTERGFAPLDDFGRGNAGAVSIQYRLAGTWTTL